MTLLESEESLSFDDDIRTFLPELHDFGPTITVRHLIHHTSGPRGTYPEPFALAGWRMTDLMTTEQVLALVVDQRELNYQPGTEFLYINSGYTLLALIVLNAAGGYYRSDDAGTWGRVPLTDSVVGPTNAWSTVEDLANWDRNFVSGEVGGPEVVARVIEPGRLDDGTPLGYAFGLEASPDAQHRGWRIIEHGGQHGGHCSWMVRFPDAGIAVAFLFNSFMWSTREFALRVADLYLEDRSPDLPVERAAVGASVEVTDPGRWAGVYVDPARAVLRTVAFEYGTLTYEHMPLTAIGPERFVIDAEPFVEVEFSLEDRNPIVTTYTASGSYRYESVDPPDGTPEMPDEFTGVYESPELGVRWHIAAAKASSRCVACDSRTPS